MKNGIIIMFLSGFVSVCQVDAQSAIGQLETMSGGTVSRSSSMSSASMRSMITGAILQNFFNSILSSPAAGPQETDAQLRAAKAEELRAAELAAQQQRLREEKARADYERMMQSYKLLDDSQDINIKSFESPELEFKSLNGEAEKISSDNRVQFEPGYTSVPDPGEKTGTEFFGDIMPVEDIQLLLDIETNPDIVDLRDADRYIKERNGQDSAGIVTLLRKYGSEAGSKPDLIKPDCIRLRDKLKGYINQREQFKKTVELSQNELDIWETANNNAILNAAKDGLEYFTGEILRGLTNRGKAADRLTQVYKENARQMASEGINITELETKINNLRAISSAGQIAEFTGNVNDWESFAKNGLNSLLKRLGDSNDDIQKFLDEPAVRKYFEKEEAELKALLDISKLASSNMVFGKWVAKKLPVIAVIELSIKQTYNGLDYLLSLNRIIEARKINGGVKDAAMYIQKNIDETYLSLTNCM